MEGEGQERNRSLEAEAVIAHLVVVPLPGTDGLYNFFCLDFSPVLLCSFLDADQEREG